MLFTQQDAVQSFSLGTLAGYQTGTAIGQISGTSYVDFHFAFRPDCLSLTGVGRSRIGSQQLPCASAVEDWLVAKFLL